MNCEFCSRLHVDEAAELACLRMRIHELNGRLDSARSRADRAELQLQDYVGRYSGMVENEIKLGNEIHSLELQVDELRKAEADRIAAAHKWAKRAEDAELQVDELKAEVKKAHDFHGYRNGIGACVCKWCAEKQNDPAREAWNARTDDPKDVEKRKCACGAEFTPEGHACGYWKGNSGGMI